MTDAGRELLDRSAPLAESLRDEMLSYFRENLATALDGAVRRLVARMSR